MSARSPRTKKPQLAVTKQPPWEHPDWYDLHDTSHSAGSEREPEHYRELVLALPPLDRDDHLIDVGAGTGKLACLIAHGYPRLGRVTLIEPNAAKLAIASERLRDALPRAVIEARGAELEAGARLPSRAATLLTVGSVFMPVMTLRAGTLAEGLDWMRCGLGELRGMLRPGGWAYLLETLAAPWERGGPDGPARRLVMNEWMTEVAAAGFEQIECIYRFRDRVTLRGRAPAAATNRNQ